MTIDSSDWRKTCAELIEDVRYLINCIDDGDHDPVALLECREHLWQTRTALAQPELKVAGDEELEATARAAEIQCMKEHGGLTASTTDGIHAQLQGQRLAGLRAVAVRYATPQPAPVPVAERLPGREDCAPWPHRPGAPPWCWCGKQGPEMNAWQWRQIGISCFTGDLMKTLFLMGYTHWARWDALPVPGAEVG
jgi:hypothetical protein